MEYIILLQEDNNICNRHFVYAESEDHAKKLVAIYFKDYAHVEVYKLGKHIDC